MNPPAVPGQDFLGCHPYNYMNSHQLNQHHPAEQLGELKPHEEKILGDILQSSGHEHHSSVPPPPPKSKAQLYAYQPVQEISLNIITGKMTLPESPTDLAKITVKPEQPPPPPTLFLDPEEHKRKMKHIYEIKQQQDKIKRQRDQESKRKRREEQEKLLKFKEEMEQSIRKDKQDRVKKRLQEIEDIKRKRKQAVAAAELELSSLKGSRTIQQMNISKYKKQFLLPKLEEQKQRLEIIKKNKRSISIDEIKDHERKYIEAKQKIDEDKKKQAKEDEWIYTPPTYRSKSFQVLLQEEKQMEQKKKEQEAKIKATIQSNKAKLTELLKSRVQQFKPKRTKSPSEGQKSPNFNSYDYAKIRKQKGNSYLQEIRKLNKKSPKNKLLQARQNQINGENPSDRFTPQAEIKKYKNLSKQSKTHLEIINIHHKNIRNIAQNEKRSFSQRQKLLKYQADRMDELIQRKKFLQKVRKPKENELDQTMDIVMASIQAKLAIVNMHKANNNMKNQEKDEEPR